ncbi:MAG TPA: DUF2196 domain-containing protein [Symbiobacteriaceae bacterium]|nr:DUF2196 domain-containing protein [Symbiobacteriaceae bacterium]
MAHLIQVKLNDVKALAAAVKELEWYTGAGGYVVAGVTAEGDGSAVWTLEARPVAPAAADTPKAPVERRRTVEPGDEVVVETKGQQMARRFGRGESDGAEGTVFRVLTRGPHPHGMKVELRDGTVGRVKRNKTMPGAGEPAG